MNEENLNETLPDESFEAHEAETEGSPDAELGAEFEQNARRALAAFEEAYPEVEELPEQVITEIITTDKSPIEAYQGYLLELKDLEIAKLRKQQSNRASTPGSVSGSAPANFDAFLSEFNLD